MFAVLLVLVSGATIQVEAPAFARPWDKAPAQFDITEFGPGVMARVLDASTGQELPAKVQQQFDKRYVYWIRTDDGSRPAPYTIETEAAPAAMPVFVGAGDMLAYGRYGVTADLGGDLRDLKVDVHGTSEDIEAQDEVAAAPFAEVPLGKLRSTLGGVDP